MYDDSKKPDNDLLDAVKRVLTGTAKEGDIEKIASEEQENIQKENEKYSEYEKFFMKTLKKFGVDSPAELSPEKKKEFFDFIDANYKAKDEKTKDEDSAVGPRMTKKGLIDGRTKAYKETVKRLIAKKGENK